MVPVTALPSNLKSILISIRLVASRPISPVHAPEIGSAAFPRVCAESETVATKRQQAISVFLISITTPSIGPAGLPPSLKLRRTRKFRHYSVSSVSAFPVLLYAELSRFVRLLGLKPTARGCG